MKIIFDSNVWQNVVLPMDFPNDASIADFVKINQAIIDGKIEAFLSETMFTIEAIKKVERKEFFSSTKAKVTRDESETFEGVLSLRTTVGPNDKDAITFDNRPILKKYFDEAVRLGFQIVRLPRIGGLVNPEVESVRYKQDDASFEVYYDKACEVGDKIENSGAGFSQILEISQQYDRIWYKGLKNAPESDSTKIAKAAAEWADGDSVAISIGLGCDYFCTRDQAKGAGNKSVLSVTNLNWLQNDYGFKTILPEDLAKRI